MREVIEADKIAKGNKDLLLELLEEAVFDKVTKNPSMMYSDYWKTLKDLGK